MCRVLALFACCGLACVCGTSAPVEPTDPKPLFGGDVVVSVSASGRVLLLERMPRSEVPYTFDTPWQLHTFMRRRRADEREAAQGEERSMPPRSVVVLRADRGTPFEKTDPVMRACLYAGYERFRLQVMREWDTVACEVVLNSWPHKGHNECIVRVSATATGEAAAITVRENRSADAPTAFAEPGDLFLDHLKRSAARDRWSKNLIFQFAPNLNQATVVRLLDVGKRSGFDYVVPVVDVSVVK